MSENTQINVSTTTEIVNVEVTETLQPVSLECFFAQGLSSETVVNVSENVLNVDLDITETQSQNVEIDFTYPVGPRGAQGPAGISLWGTISGTLSSQTDLWRYLSAVGTSNFDIPTLTNYLSTNNILLCSLNVNGQILSAGTDLFDIFLTSETDSQTLSYNALNYLLSISNGNTVNLSSINSTFASNSGKYESVYSNVQSNSANWNSAYNVATAYSSISSSFATNTALNATSSVLLPTSVYQNASGNFAPYDYVNTNFLALSGGIVSGPVRINNNLTVFGNLTASGTTTFANTIFSVTSALSVVHIGSGPAVWISNNGDGDIASFYDTDQGIEVLHVGGQNGTFPNVGVKTSQPNKDFTVRGEISASNTIYDNVGNSTQWNQAYNIGTFVQNNSAFWEESADIIPTVTNYLSTNNVLISALTITNTLSDLNSLTIFGNISGNNTRVSFNQGTATGFRSFATNTGQATGSNSFAEGNSTRAHGSGSHAEGIGTLASGTGSHAEGNDNIASGTYAHAQGSNNEARGLISHAMGSRTRAVGDYSFAGGRRAVAKDNYSYVWATEQSPATREISSTRVGQYMVSASGGVFIPGNIGIGTDNNLNALTVVGNISGNNSRVSFNRGRAVGTTSFATNNALASGDNSFAAANGTAFGVGSIVLGSGAAYGVNSITIGAGQAFGNSSVVVGGGLAYGTGSVSIGGGSAIGSGSYAEGQGIATGQESHAEGYNTATGKKVNFQSYNNTTRVFTFAPEASAAFNDVFPGDVLRGYENDFLGEYITVTVQARNTETGSITSLNPVIGGNSTNGYFFSKSGTYAHAEGFESVASGDYSHAEGDFTEASGQSSHAEGLNTIASGDHSHAEGIITTAFGYASHAEGRYTQALGSTSHAAGYGATAAQNFTYAWSDGELGTREPNLSSTREGQYMIDATGGVYIIKNVGIGTDSIDNALTVVGTISTSNHGNSNLWNQAYNTATVYQTNSATYAPKVELRSHSMFSSGDYAVQQGRNVELSFGAGAAGTNITITLPRQDTNDNAQSGDELLIRLNGVQNSSTVTVRQYTYTGSLPYLGTFTNLITFPANTPGQTIRLRLTNGAWSLLPTPNLFSPTQIGLITPNTGTFTTLSATGVVHASGGNSNLWNSTFTNVQSNSANWQSTFVTVCALSAAWEESADIIPTVTNYLSTSNNTTIINDSIIFENLEVGALTVTHPDSRIAGRYYIDRLAGTGELIYRKIDSPSVYIARLISPPGWYFLGLDPVAFGNGYYTSSTYPWGNSLEGGTANYLKIPFPPFGPDPVPSVNASIKKIDVLGSFRSVSTIQSLSTVIAQGGNSEQWNRSFNISTAYQNISSSFLLQGGNTLAQTLSVGTNDNQHLVLETGGTNRVTILSSGNVGIGTSNPTNPLTVQGSVSAVTYFGDGSNLTGINFTLSSSSVTLSTTTLNPIAILSGTNFITSRVLQDKLSEVISVKDFGARGDGVTNDWLSIQRALSAAAGIARVYIPQGLYFISQELRIPSNSYIYGAGIGTTIIKLSSTANATQCVMTNSQNTRSIATNQGNENITIKDLELDGNVSRFPGSYSPVGDTSGTGLCFAYVKNALVERVSVHDTCRHCFDICAPETSITFNPLDYTPNPSFNVHLKDIIAYGAGDDNITTHFSNSIIIENAYVPYTGGTEVPTNSNGIEIDDGSYDITIIGGYIKNCRRGLEIKGHSWAPAAKRVKVYGLTVENCVRNFGIRHLGFDNTDSKTAFDISLYDCTSIAPLSSTFTTDTPRSLQISNYDGVYIKDFRVVGEHNASRAVTIQERARNVKIDGMTFTQISGAITGITDALLYVDNTTQRNVTLQNIIFRDCVGLPIYITGNIPGIVIDGVDAFTTVSPKASSVVDFTWAPTTVPYTVRNVSVSGYNYAHTLGGSHDFDYTLPSNVGLIENIVPSSSASANTQYTVAKFGWREGTGQSLNAGIGVRVDFTSNIFSGVSAGLDVPVAYIGTRKVNGTDSDVTSNLAFGTLSANNSTPVDRLTITSTGNVGINTTTPNNAAILQLDSTTRGFLPPRMTTAQRDTISIPPSGLMVYNTTTNLINYYTGSTWVALATAAA